MTQAQKIHSYLKEKKIATTNELRNTFHIVDVPKAVSILIRRGVSITAKRNHDGTATYYLDYTPQGFKEEDFIFKNGTAYRKEDIKPEQQNLL